MLVMLGYVAQIIAGPANDVRTFIQRLAAHDKALAAWQQFRLGSGQQTRRANIGTQGSGAHLKRHADAGQRQVAQLEPEGHRTQVPLLHPYLLR
ncbi:hypothetical protein ACHMW6_33845 [Pseudoduganella sp. UC29_106]|uniref:hypothetical protein n=1 Tax=Pseudoduganella sp. UC29_106 TaxID=3374553 RepID=UPI0037574A30